MTNEEKILKCLDLLNDEQLSNKFTTSEVLEDMENRTLRDIAGTISNLNHLVYCLKVTLKE